MSFGAGIENANPMTSTFTQMGKTYAKNAVGRDNSRTVRECRNFAKNAKVTAGTFFSTTSYYDTLAKQQMETQSPTSLRKS